MCGGKWSEARIKRQVYSQAALPKSDNMGYSAAGGGLVLGGRRKTGSDKSGGDCTSSGTR